MDIAVIQSNFKLKDFNRMLRKTRILLSMTAILLIPILLGMTPLNMVHKLASGGPFTHCKQAQLNKHCLFHSAVSHNDPSIENLDLTALDQESTPAFDIRVLDSDSIHSNLTFNSVPLRC
jgi:hypothetical protein